MRRTRALLAAAVATGAVLLAGCEPTTSTQTGTTAGGCDPNGWGPMSGCDDTDDQDTIPAADQSSDCDPSGWGPLSGCGNESGSTGEPTVWADPNAVGRIAPHEAAHKAVADEYDWTVTSVWIRDTATGMKGRTNIAGWSWKDPHRQVVCLLAGDIAAVDDSDGDETEAAQILAANPEVDEAAAVAEAERIVTARAAQIEADAADLLEDGELS